MDNRDNGRIFSDGHAEGYLRKDTFGRVFIDECPTDEEHMLKILPAGQEYRNCRKYLDDILLIPEANLGRKVKIAYEFCIDPLPEN